MPVNTKFAIIGAAGSRFDLALHALYFRGQPPRETSMREVQRVIDSGFATAIPMLARFKAEGFPIVGTTPEYLSFRTRIRKCRTMKYTNKKGI